MATYCLKISPHYSGLFSGNFPDLPGVAVLGVDHEEVIALAREALEAEIDRRLRHDVPLPPARAIGRLELAVARADPSDRANAVLRTGARQGPLKHVPGTEEKNRH